MSDQQRREMVEAFSSIATPIIGDCLARLVGTSKLRPFHTSKRLAGVARTVRVAAGDNLFIHQALNQCVQGEVIVVDGASDTQRALVGELMMLFAQSQGATGFVIDGAIRDAEAFRVADFPCFAIGQTLRGPYKNGPGDTQIPVVVDGMTVNPGDIIVGDEDGVIAITWEQASALLEAARATLRKEEETKRQIASRTTDRSWVAKRIAAL